MSMPRKSVKSNKPNIPHSFPSLILIIKITLTNYEMITSLSKFGWFCEVGVGGFGESVTPIQYRRLCKILERIDATSERESKTCLTWDRLTNPFLLPLVLESYGSCGVPSRTFLCSCVPNFLIQFPLVWGYSHWRGFMRSTFTVGSITTAPKERGV